MCSQQQLKHLTSCKKGLSIRKQSDKVLKRQNSLSFKQKTSDRCRINMTRGPNERWQIFTTPIFSSGLFSAPLYLPAVSPKRLSLAISMQARWDLAIDSRRHRINVRAQTAKWPLCPSSNKATLTRACWECVGLVGSQTSRLSAGQQRRIHWEARLLKMKLTPFVIWLTTSAKFPLMSHAAHCFLIRRILQITNSEKNERQSRRRFVSLSENGLGKTSQIYKLWNFPAEEAAYWTGNGAAIAFLLMCERNWWSVGMLRGPR